MTTSVAKNKPPRLAPTIPLPPYAYIPGATPHPVRDRAGHKMAHAPPAPETVDFSDWRGCLPHLYAIDLFNNGYYWEAHEVWEDLWAACGRRGMQARFFKALIALTAAAAKAGRGEEKGTRHHAERAAGLIESLAAGDRNGQEPLMGLTPLSLKKLAQCLMDSGTEFPDQTNRYMIPGESKSGKGKSIE